MPTEHLLSRLQCICGRLPDKSQLTYYCNFEGVKTLLVIHKCDKCFKHWHTGYCGDSAELMIDWLSDKKTHPLEVF